MPRRLKVTDINPHVICTLCDGYLVDATAIIECLHAFCRTCIVQYLENSKFCPVCDVQVHKTRPLQNIRSDQTLQDLVYKMVPGLYQDEMKRRRDFYRQHQETGVSTEPELRGEGEPRFFSPKESISLSLHHRPKDCKVAEPSEDKDPTTRHLSCPAAFTIGHLKKFIHLKFSLPSTYMVEIFYEDQPLRESYTLMDVAYIYNWKRAEPMKFFYSISKVIPKIIEFPAVQPPAAEEMEIDSVKCDTTVSDNVHEVQTTSKEDIETMQIDCELSTVEDNENIKENIPACPSSVALPPSPPLSEKELLICPENIIHPSSDDIQPMDISESNITNSHSSLPEKPVDSSNLSEPLCDNVTISSSVSEASCKNVETSCPVTESNNIPCPVTESNNILCPVTESNNIPCPVTESNNTSCPVTESNNTLCTVTESKNTLCPVTESNNTLCPVTEFNNTSDVLPPVTQQCSTVVSSSIVTEFISNSITSQSPMPISTGSILISSSVPKIAYNNIAISTPVSGPSYSSVAITSAVPEPTYNSVKLVSAPEGDPVLSPTNGLKLKFIHDPELTPKSRSKKSGRKARSSRHKNIPVRLARLAPYPPPPPPSVPVTCLTTQPLQHLSQFTVAKLVPSVITTLTPTFVTTLVSTTSNSLNKVSKDSGAPQVSSLLDQQSTISNKISTHSNGIISSMSCSKENDISTSSKNTESVANTSSTVTKNLTLSTAQQDSQILTDTKELSCIETFTKNNIVIPSSLSITSVKTSENSVVKTESLVVNTVSIPLSTLDTKVTSATTTKNIVIPQSLSNTPVKISENSVVKTESLVMNTLKISFSTLETKVSSASINSLDTQVTPSSILQTDNQFSKTSSSPASLQETGPSEIISSTSADKILHVNADTANVVAVSPPTLSSLIKEQYQNPECIKNNDKKHLQDFKNKNTDFEKMDKNSESFKRSVKNSISAEFSDNDDLGCPPDLVVDEQKMDSSDNEDDTDAALRKKINAIAEKEDEADITDDTEADSGRASDMSCPARCEDDVGSPATTETVTSVSIPPSVTASSSTDSRHAKSNNIDHVIKQLYLQHEIGRAPSSPKPPAPTPQTPAPQTATPPAPKAPAPSEPSKDDTGVLDLSTCTRKSGEVQSIRQKPVANPVMDIKHRKQPYLPAPVKQHTACPPAPKHPTSPLLLHQLTAGRHSTPSILQAQLTGNPKPYANHLQNIPYVNPGLPYPVQGNRNVSSPSSLPIRPSQPTYGYNYSQYSGIIPYPVMDVSGYAARMNANMPSRSSSNSLPKEACSSSSPSSTKPHSYTSHSKMSNSTRRLSDTFVSSALPPIGHCRISTLPSPTSVPAHPRTSPSVMTRMSPHHRSASPAPSPQNVSHSFPMSSLTPTTTAATTTSTTTPSQCKPSVPIYKKSESSHKGFKLKKKANLTVFNPDPNGFSKLVIKNLDVKSNNNYK